MSPAQARNRRVSHAIFLLACLWPAAVVAGPTELVLQLDTSLRLDSNPLRFVDDANVQASLGTAQKNDAITAVDLRAGLIHPFDSPETRLLMTGFLGRRDYHALNQLDNTENALRAAFQWRLGELWRGELLRSSERQLYRYVDGSFTQRAMTRSETSRAELALRVTPELEIPLSAGIQTSRYDNLTLQTYDRDERSLDLGARWRAATLSTLRAGYRSVQTTFVNRTAAQVATLDSAFRDSEAYASGEWQYSVLSRVSGRLGYLRRAYQTLDTRNFSVVTTEVQASYDYSPLTRFTAEIWNRPFGTTDLSSLYAIVTGVQLGVRWYATPKTRVNLLVTDELQRYKLTAVGAALSSP
ncbi:MAG: hypothetical protein RLZZ401_2330, partial [Pseudomonadota bacterium]